MEELRQQLEAKGINTSQMSEATVKSLAKDFGLEIPRITRSEANKGAVYVVTESFTVPHRNGEPGKTQKARGIYVRIEALDQAITDLTSFRDSLNKNQ